MNNKKYQDLLNSILKSRNCLHTLTKESNTLCDKRILAKSQELDKLIIKYYKNINKKSTKKARL